MEEALRVKGGVVLAAGFGTRLKPLSDIVPKPLVPVANRPLIHYSLALLARAGARNVVINLHHHGEAIASALGMGAELGVRITYSREEVILGTGGGVVRARRLLPDGAFFVLNSDVLTAVDLDEVLRFHRERGADATMVVRALPPGTDYTPLLVDEEGWLCGFKGITRGASGVVRPCMFEGVHVLTPALFDFLPGHGFSCLADQGYLGMLGRGLKVACFQDPGPWFDLGTPGLYLAANRAVLSGRARFPQLDRVGISSEGVLLGREVRCGTGVKLGPEVAVGDGCTLGDGAVVARSVLWTRTEVGIGELLDGCILAGPHRLQL